LTPGRGAANIAAMPRRDQVTRRPAWRRWTRRLLGVAATAVVLAVGVVAANMVLSDDDEVAQPPAEAAAKAKQRASPQSRAAAVLRKQGYRPVSLADYHADHTLRVLIGAPRDGTPRGRRAFFFVRNRYIGRDASAPSLRLRAGRQLDREISLVYTLFEPGDTGCCPNGGETRVHFRWTGSKLRPREEIPPAARRMPEE
jgi:hypothetical protein